MNVGQLARNQQMMYQVISRNGGAYQSMLQGQYASLSSLGGKAQNANAADLLQSMGYSAGMGGRTVREMAQSQLRTQDTQHLRETAAPQTSGLERGLGSLTGIASRQQFIPLSEETTKTIQSLALEDAKSSVTGKAMDGKERTKLIQDQLRKYDPSQRSAAYNSMNKLWEKEMDRIGDHIREKDADWNTWGDKFDAKVLEDYKAGVNMWI